MVGAKSASEDGKLLHLMLKVKEEIEKEFTGKLFASAQNRWDAS